MNSQTAPTVTVVRKLNKILLIDDSRSDNYLHSRRINKIGAAEVIMTCGNGKEALDYLTTADKAGNFPRPELVFLDINMPVMNGWEFLEKYEQLEEKYKAKVVLAMLTTSVAERDRERAQQHPDIAKYTEKPLTEEELMDILREHFPEHLG